MNCCISKSVTLFSLFPIMFISLIIFTAGFAQSKLEENEVDKVTAEDLQISIVNPESKRTISAGTGCYIVGTQDGNFPPLGWHILDEMGGVWFPPLKALDGIWLRVNGEYLTSAKKYTRKAGWVEFEFEADGLQVNRKDVALDDKPGALFVYTIKNNSSAKKQFELDIITRIHPILSFPFVQNIKEFNLEWRHLISQLKLKLIEPRME